MSKLKRASIFYSLFNAGSYLPTVSVKAVCELLRMCERGNWYCLSSVTHHMLTQALTANATKWNAEYPSPHTLGTAYIHTNSLSILTCILSLLSPCCLSYSCFHLCIVFLDRLRSLSAGLRVCVCVCVWLGFGWQDLLKAELWIFHDVWCSDMGETDRDRGEEKRGVDVRKPKGGWEQGGRLPPGCLSFFIVPLRNERLYN